MINVALIGLGNIALLFDNDKSNKSTALSHVKSIFLNEKFDLKYAVHINFDNENILKEFFPKCKVFNNHFDIVNKEDIDILVIATPTNNHFDIIKDFQKNEHIKMFFVEKPLFSKKEEYEDIDELVKEKIVVNYLRRFSPAFIDLKNRISSDNKIEKIVINYCKGLKNNGSHLIDILNYIFDDLEIKTTNIFSSNKGFDENDLCYDLYINVYTNNKIFPIIFISHDYEKYNLISMDIYTQTQQIKFLNSDSSINYYKIKADDNFPTYKVFENSGEKVDINNKYLMYYAYEKLADILENNGPNISSFYDELKNKKFLEQILKDL